MLTRTNESFTRTETLTDADLDQVAGGFCTTPPEMWPPRPIRPPVRPPVCPRPPRWPDLTADIVSDAW